VLFRSNQSADIGFGEMESLLWQAYELKNAYGFDTGINTGEKADIIVTDYIPATLFNKDTFLGHFIYGITEARVQHVIKGNRLLLDNYEVTTDPYKELKSEAQRVSRELFSRFSATGRRTE
jgi:hypothetical protein